MKKIVRVFIVFNGKRYRFDIEKKRNLYESRLQEANQETQITSDLETNDLILLDQDLRCFNEDIENDIIKDIVSFNKIKLV